MTFWDFPEEKSSNVDVQSLGSSNGSWSSFNRFVFGVDAGSRRSLPPPSFEYPPKPPSNVMTFDDDVSSIGTRDNLTRKGVAAPTTELPHKSVMGLPRMAAFGNSRVIFFLLFIVVIAVSTAVGLYVYLKPSSSAIDGVQNLTKVVNVVDDNFETGSESTNEPTYRPTQSPTLSPALVFVPVSAHPSTRFSGHGTTVLRGMGLRPKMIRERL